MVKKILFSIFLFFSAFSFAQTETSDCSGAIKICGDGAISSNANGVGQQELTGRNNCSSEEHNSLWLEIEITKAGTLGFTLKPTSSNLEIDYDFFIFGPKVSCGSLGEAIRCSTTNPLASNSTSNHTGMNDRQSDTSEGPGQNGNNFVRSLDVLPGETYFIVIDRPIGNSPFELEWNGTSTVGEFPFPEGPDINKPNDLETCNANGVSDFDIRSTASEIVTQNNTSLSYHETLADASDNTNQIQGSYTSNSPVKTIYARVENDLTGCAEITEFDLIINDGPILNENNIIGQCDLDQNGLEEFVLTDQNSTILNGLNPNDYLVEYFYSPDEANVRQNPIPTDYSSAGNETIYARVSESSNPDCFNIAEVSLIVNSPPQIESYTVIQPQVNSNSNTISMEIDSASEYEYSIGNIDGPYQTSTIFNNVNSGLQTVYIRDLNGCAIITRDILILGYDNFFSPNNDGINDLWQLKGVDPELASATEIFIFDRYGKLLQKLSADDRGWDGTYNGRELPADEYWFRVNILNTGEFNGHFSLVRRILKN